SNIAKPPPVFEPYQSIEGSPEGLTKFMKDLFVSGVLTKGNVLNADVAKVASEDGALVTNIARDLAEKFDAGRVDEQLYEKRLTISVKYSSPGKLDPDNSIIAGDAQGLSVIGFQPLPGMKWADVRNAIGTSADWPLEVEKAMPAVASGRLP